MSIDLEILFKKIRLLNSIQVTALSTVVDKFAEKQNGELVRSDFLFQDAFDYFSVRLAVHHASSSVPLKKENFEHILESSFRSAGLQVTRPSGMTTRGADLTVSGTPISLKTEAAKSIKQDVITISKLMEAAWIKQIKSREDLIPLLSSRVLPHFLNYERIFILRSYRDTEIENHIRYDLREIPLSLLQRIGSITPDQFTPLTRTRTTRADILLGKDLAFRLRIDGSDDKITITDLATRLCPLHAWWSLQTPGN